MSNYFNEKSKMYYENYKNGKLTKKVGSIIRKENKYLTILRKDKRPMFAGGSVDNGETTRQAIVREVFEETGAKVTKLKYLARDYYSVNWKFEDITFPNKRVEYTYLCEVEDKYYKAIGLDGEFNEETIVKWCTLQELESLGLWGPTLELIKKIEKEHIEI